MHQGCYVLVKKICGDCSKNVPEIDFSVKHVVFEQYGIVNFGTLPKNQKLYMHIEATFLTNKCAKFCGIITSWTAATII